MGAQHSHELDFCEDSPPVWLEFVLKHCGPKERFALLTLNKKWFESLNEGDHFWRCMCRHVADDHKLYMPADMKICPHADGWKAMFLDLWAIRNRWIAPVEPGSPMSVVAEGNAESATPAADVEAEDKEISDELRETEHRFSISTCIRFRPKVDTAGGASGEKAITLPLHQRLALVKAKHGVKSSKDAMRILMSELGKSKEAEADPFTEAGAVPEKASLPEKENQLAAANKEPTHGADMGSKDAPDESKNDHIEGEHYQCGVLDVQERDGVVLAVAPGVGLRDFKYHRAFDVCSDQADVYSYAARRLIIDFVNGFNGTLLVYGQTGSGKTFTMTGPPGLRGTDLDSHKRGIIPRTCEEVLAAVHDREEAFGIKSEVSVSFVEIFGNEVSDLLRNGDVVGQSRVAGQRYVLDGKTEKPVSTLGDIQALLAEGEAQKRRAATAMNERSSRAHAVFVISLTQRMPGTLVEHTSKLFLADLGGAEKLSKSKADADIQAAGTSTWREYYDRRERLQEALYINRGLFALKSCIEALHNAEEARAQGRTPPYVPYQDSKLTMLLSSALGGNCKTTVCVCASKEQEHAQETLQALRFGEQCGRIKTTGATGGAALKAALAKLDRQIDELRADVIKHERWETRKEVRKDVDADTGVVTEEVVIKTVPVGAEIYNSKLNVLLARRAELLGETFQQLTGDAAKFAAYGTTEVH